MPSESDTFESIPAVRLKKVGDFTTPSFIQRHELNPILTAPMMPYPSSLVFNRSVVEYHGRLLMMFRNEWYPTRGVPTGKVSHLGVAESDDGIHWTPRPELIDLDLGVVDNRCYDPRAIKIEDTYYVTLCQGGVRP